MECHGNGPDHCCYINGVCPYLEENTVPGRRWACGLYREHGTWQAVYQDPQWRTSHIKAWFDETHPGYGCGDWPQNIPKAAAQPSGKCCWEPG